MDSMDSIYDGDPRVRWAGEQREVAYLPDGDVEDAWMICLDGNHWNVFGPQGFCLEASWKDTVDEAIAAVIGPPLWAVEAQMISAAAGNHGWLDAAGTPDTETVGGAAAIDNLKYADMFVPYGSDGRTTGYILSAYGWDLATALDGLTDDEVCRLILDRIPQKHTYGATDGPSA